VNLCKASIVFLFGITFLGFILRISNLASSPAGLYIDETSIGYNAYSLIITGRDEHGKFLPLFFEAFGEYKLPIYIYSVAFVQLFLGPTDLSVRLPAVIFGTLTILLIFFLSKELLRNNSNQTLKVYVPHLAAFLLAISSWHLQFSRPGFEASVGLFFLTFALYTFFRAVRENSTFVLSISTLSFVLTLYSYNSARIVTPIVLATLLILYFKKFPLFTWVKVLLIGTVIALPFIIFSVSLEGLLRARQVSIFFQSTNNSILKQFLINYWANISPFYLFMKGDPTIAHLTSHRMSLLYLVESPFFFFGFAMLFIKRSREYFFVLILLLTAFIPPAISTLNPHALRSVLVLPATVFISALGFGYFLAIFKSKDFQKIAAGVFVAILSISTLRFLNVYHNKYVIDAGWDWQVGIRRASQRVLEVENKYNDIYFDLDPRRIPLVWYLKINPKLYQTNPNKNHLGKYHINENISSVHGLYIGLQQPEGKLLEYVYYPNNTVAYGIWEF